MLTDIEIKVLEIGLDFAPIQKKLNESKLRSGFRMSFVECIYNGFSGWVRKLQWSTCI